jgi:serine/threonine protein phosphatase PrpC
VRFLLLKNYHKNSISHRAAKILSKKTYQKLPQKFNNKKYHKSTQKTHKKQVKDQWKTQKGIPDCSRAITAYSRRIGKERLIPR